MSTVIHINTLKEMSPYLIGRRYIFNADCVVFNCELDLAQEQSHYSLYNTGNFYFSKSVKVYSIQAAGVEAEASVSVTGAIIAGSNGIRVEKDLILDAKNLELFPGFIESYANICVNGSIFTCSTVYARFSIVVQKDIISTNEYLGIYAGTKIDAGGCIEAPFIISYRFAVICKSLRTWAFPFGSFRHFFKNIPEFAPYLEKIFSGTYNEKDLSWFINKQGLCNSLKYFPMLKYQLEMYFKLKDNITFEEKTWL